MYVYQNACVQTDPVTDRYTSAPKRQPVTDKCGKNIGITTNNNPIGSNYNGLNLPLFWFVFKIIKTHSSVFQYLTPSFF